MNRLGFAIASAMLLASTSAYAQVGATIGVTPTGSSVDFYGPPYNPNNLPAAGSSQGTGTTSDGPQAYYQTQIDITDTTISFKAADSTTGSPFSEGSTSIGASSTMTVGFDFNNPGATPVDFESTIIAAGMGFQVIDTRTGREDAFGNPILCSFQNCGPTTSVDYGFESFGSPSPEVTTILGQVGFNFDISDNGQSIYNVNGTLNLLYGPNGIFLDDANLFGPGSADDLLVNFQSTGDGQRTAGFSWDATGVHRSLGSGSHSLSYSTQVYSWSGARCVADGYICLVSYAGFGDPIGRGGGVEAVESLGGRLGSFASNSAIPGGATFNLPTFDGNTLRFESVNAVPEPGTWALMILGFGGVGAALRRRRARPVCA